MKPFLFLMGLIRCAIGVAVIMGIAFIVFSWGIDLMSRSSPENAVSAEVHTQAAASPGEDMPASAPSAGDPHDEGFAQGSREAELLPPLVAPANFKPISVRSSTRKIK